MNKRLKNTLWVITAYLAVLGVLFTFAPNVARSTFGIALNDPVLTLLYGQVVLTLAFMAYLIASNENLAKMTTGFLVLFTGHVLVFIYQLSTGAQTFAQVGPPLVLSVIFALLLYSFRE